jgi:hypothetical protein
MPINYEPPSPVAPYTSAAYGAAEEYDKMAPLVAQYRQQQVQAGLAGAQAYNQGIESTVQRSGQAAQQNTQLEALHQNQLFQNQEQQRQYAQQAQMQYAQQEQQAAQQRAQQEQEQRMLQQHMDTQFSQAQELQRQKYDQASSWVQQQLDAKMITPEDATNMLATIHGIQSPLELKKMKAEAAYKESQAQEQQALVEQHTQQQLRAATLTAQTVEERTKPILNGSVEARVRAALGPFNPGAMAALGVQSQEQAQQIYEAEVRKRVLADPNGVEHYVHTDINGKETIKEPHRKSKDESDKDLGLITPTAFDSHVRGEDLRVNAVVRRVQKADPNNTPENGGWDAAKVEAEISKNVREHFGMPTKDEHGDPFAVRPTHAEYEAFMRYKGEQGPTVKSKPFAFPGSNPAPQGSAAGTPAPTTPNTAVGQQDVPKPQDTTPQKPFKYQELDKASPQQRDMVKAWTDFHDMVDHSALPEQEKKNASEQIHWAIRQLEKYGSAANMASEDPAAYQQYNAIIAAIQPIKRKSKDSSAPTTAVLTPFANPVGTLNSLGVIKDGKLNIRIPQSFGRY